VETEQKSSGTEGKTPRRRRGRRWTGAGVAVVVFAVVAFVVAQGGGSGGGPLNAIAKAAEVTQREPGGRAVIHATVTSSDTPKGITETGSVIFDDSGRARGTMTVRSHSTGKEVKLLAIAAGAKSYTSSDLLESITEGKKWMELDLSSALPDPTPSAPNVGGPKEGLKVLELVQGAEEVGKGEIHGVPTRHYRGTFPAAEEVFGVKVDASDLHVDVWIDAQDRVRRMQVALTSSLPGAENSATSTNMTIDYVSFGRVPKIELPSPDEVFNATSEFESGLQSATEGN
jgi:hypothetical protein